MALWDKIYTIVEEHEPYRGKAELVDEIIAAVEDDRKYEEEQAAADRRWNEGRY